MRNVQRKIDILNCNQERTPKQWKKYGASLYNVLVRIKKNYSMISKMDILEKEKNAIHKKAEKTIMDERRIEVIDRKLIRMDKKVDKTFLKEDVDLFYSLFRPLILRKVIDYFPKISHCYDKQDFFNDINLIFLELIRKYRFKYYGIAYFMFYVKFMIDKNLIPLIKDILADHDNNYYYIEDTIDLKKSYDYIFNQDIDNQIYWNTFWKKVREESKEFGKLGEKLIEAYFFSGKKMNIKKIAQKYRTKRNLYIIYDKFKKHLRKAMINYTPEGTKTEPKKKTKRKPRRPK